MRLAEAPPHPEFATQIPASPPHAGRGEETHTFHTADRHLDRRVEAVPDVDGRDREDQRCKLALVEMLGGLIPDRVGHRILAVGETGDRLGQSQRGALGFAEIRRVAPGRDGEQALVGLAGLAGDLRVHVDADAATIDLAGAQVHQFQELFRQALFGQVAERLQNIHGLGQDHTG
ncbi:hypothetical protein ABIE71_003052 [Bradyrhizobium diazoefficiens]